MNLSFSKITRPEALVICTWEYQPPYDIYNQSKPPTPEEVEAILNPLYEYHVMRDEDGNLVGCCGFGDDARVAGGCYAEEALDVGIGIRPDLTGQGLGKDFTRAVLTFAEQHFSPKVMRVTIAAFNQRAQQVCINTGFIQTDSFVNPAGRPFIIFTKSS